MSYALPFGHSQYRPHLQVNTDVAWLMGFSVYSVPSVVRGTFIIGGLLPLRPQRKTSQELQCCSDLKPSLSLRARDLRESVPQAAAPHRSALEPRRTPPGPPEQDQ